MTASIRVENLGKQYRIGATQPGKASLREALGSAVTMPFRRLLSTPGSRGEQIWAVRDLNFEIAAGEAVGIIGRNGAGKSTLLKLLSRITRPTTGRALLRGRPTSLLEVGTGFHPDLTGRENIYLNGAVLGMSRAQISAKFDAIVAFAEIERFLDTPVKHYSSGMYMRLAFAVAAHLEPSILILDEVLAVGDATFQTKCRVHMEQMIGRGCTLVLVSHNLHAVATLCSRALFLDSGTLRADGPAREVISSYLSEVTCQHEDAGESRWPDPEQAPGNDSIRLRAVRVLSERHVTSRVNVQAPVQIEVEYWNLQPDTRVYTSIALLEESGVGVLSSANLPAFNLSADDWHDKPQPAGIYRSTCTIPANLLNHNRYVVGVHIVTNMAQTAVHTPNVISFQVYDGEPERGYAGAVMGVIRPRLEWQTELLQLS